MLFLSVLQGEAVSGTIPDMALLKSLLSPIKITALVAVIVVTAVASGVLFSRNGQSVSTAVATEEPQPIAEIKQWVFTALTSEEIPEPVTEKVSMIIAGDIMLDRNVYNATKRAGNYEHPFLLMGPVLEKYDVTIVNLEGPITETPFNMKRAQSMSFTFDPKFTEPLAKHFDIVSLANNHTHNQGEKGLLTTKKYLTDAGVEFFGDPINREGYTGRVFERNGFKIGLIGYHAFGSPESKTIPVIEKQIKEMKLEADYIIVVPHWGPEYRPTGHPSQVAAGHRFIDAGADVVIGGHPHVVQNVEEYKGHKIFYSLGNFIFDQYFSKETMEGMMVAIELTRGTEGVSAAFETVPYKINKESQPFLED